MTTRTLRALMIAIALLLGSPLAVFAREMRALWFAFEIPDSWVAEGNGGEKFFATGAKQAFSPPVVLGEACVPSGKNSCTNFRLPDPPTEFAQQGCADAAAHRLVRPNEILETRWVCAPVTVSGTRATTGVSVFTFNGSILYVAYLAGDTDTEVTTFLEQLARSLKVNP